MAHFTMSPGLERSISIDSRPEICAKKNVLNIGVHHVVVCSTCDAMSRSGCHIHTNDWQCVDDVTCQI